MNGDKQDESLHLNNGYPKRTYLGENNYKAINTTYQQEIKPNKK